jgi:hypothetical protein
MADSTDVVVPCSVDPAEHEITFMDYDDSILPTSDIKRFRWHVKDSERRLTSARKLLTPLAEAAFRVLEQLGRRSTVCIVTNAAHGWLEQSRDAFLPSLKPLFAPREGREAAVRAYSSRARYARSFPRQPIMWKTCMMNSLMMRQRRRLRKLMLACGCPTCQRQTAGRTRNNPLGGVHLERVVSIGDCDDEWNAALASTFLQAHPNHTVLVKMAARPTIHELEQQLVRLEEGLPERLAASSQSCEWSLEPVAPAKEKGRRVRRTVRTRSAGPVPTDDPSTMEAADSSSNTANVHTHPSP